MSADDQEASREAVIRSLAEELRVERKIVVGDTVRVRTVTTETDRAVEAMLRHETVEIEHVACDREVETMPQTIHQGDVTIVPIVKEVLVVRRQLVLVEEIHIRRVAKVEPFATTVTLREQRADITREPPPEVAEANATGSIIKE